MMSDSKQNQPGNPVDREYDLSIRLQEEVARRREISVRLNSANRKQRAEILEEHRAVKRIEYALADELAEIRMTAAVLTGSAASIKSNRKRIKRSRSRLEHSDWLVWTRSVWKFKEMESDAKKGEHPAQFSARVPQRLIQMFSFSGDTILDPFVGSGTTCVEAARLGRSSIGLDINEKFLEIARRRIDKLAEVISASKKDGLFSRVQLGDARNMSDIKDSSIQMIIAHPPYWNCVKISDLENDLSNCDNDSYSEFLSGMSSVLSECFRVLESDRVAVFMIGDITRKVNGITRLFPLHSDILVIAQNLGFLVWDIYIVETKMRNSGGMPMMGSYPYPHKIFAQFSHNYLLVLRKPLITLGG